MPRTTADPNRKKVPGSGRPKGSKNKLSALAKENIIAVFTRLGGTAAMAEWARENQTEFYKIYSKLLPIEVNGPDGGPISPAAIIIQPISTKNDE